MIQEYDAQQCARLAGIIEDAALHYRHAPSRYDAGHQFRLDITGVCPATTGQATLEVERFVGGGFAGQVYRTTLTALDLQGDDIPGLAIGGRYAVKIMLPPSRFSLLFRNVIYGLAYQGAFSPQVNPAAARAGVLWQKLIRRGAALHFGDQACVADTYATFFDAGLGSFGEINEWVDGRTWRFDVDDTIFQRRKRPSDAGEYLAKKAFMGDFVRLLHEMGAPELARQYEWWTCKSQPNVLKRLDAGEGPADGLTALDFRAGLALLPFLPMSPGDIPLIMKGLRRGALVQFDRGNLAQLDAYCEERREDFADLAAALDELKDTDPAYRASLPDVTHHGLRPLHDRALASSIRDGFIQSWRARGFLDEEHAEKVSRSFCRFVLVISLGFVPFLGRFTRRLLGNAAFARHIGAILSNFGYFRRALRAYQARTLADWYRAGRVSDKRLDFYLSHSGLFWLAWILPGLLPLPPKWHRFLTDFRFAGRLMAGAVVYPIKFYRDVAFREQWLTNEIESGAGEGMLTSEERARILARVPDPYIQKYLKCVAVHVCTLPITQIISVLAAVYAYFAFGDTWQESWVWALGVLTSFQFLPISPGSFVRGTYVVYLMIKERNWRNYWVAVLVSYWHYIGYLGFPLQMVTEFPALARFMAGRWATKMVRFIPVFGERGALLEHVVFDVFFNVPLSVKRLFSRKTGQAEP